LVLIWGYWGQVVTGFQGLRVGAGWVSCTCVLGAGGNLVTPAGAAASPCLATSACRRACARASSAASFSAIASHSFSRASSLNLATAVSRRRCSDEAFRRTPHRIPHLAPTSRRRVEDGRNGGRPSPHEPRVGLRPTSGIHPPFLNSFVRDDAGSASQLVCTR
jgi:hypothetical protein